MYVALYVGGVEWVTKDGQRGLQMTSWLRHNDVTEGQKYSLTESRLETETNIHNLENPSLEIFFVSISGNERKFPYLCVLESNKKMEGAVW